MKNALKRRIHDANIEVHRVEADYYDLIHHEIFNRHEQRRIMSTLKHVDKLIIDNKRKALDFGTGTGNLTAKLLYLGYEVTAIDISSEMCNILRIKLADRVKEGRLRVIRSKIEDTHFEEGEFDLITCYSVLHHLPDYVKVIQSLCAYLKKGGVIYLDHELSPFLWDEYTHNRKLTYVYNKSVIALGLLTNLLYLRGRLLSITPLDYSLSDFWTKKEHHLDHSQIRNLFEKLNFNYFKREDYYLHHTKIPNPIYYIYKCFCKPDMSLWIARK